MDAQRLLRFESFELDVRSRELRKGKQRIRLQEQPFEILRLMLERPGDVVTREELARHLWPQGTFVDFEHSLNAAVKRLRAALGDDADNPRFVETIHRLRLSFQRNSVTSVWKHVLSYSPNLRPIRRLCSRISGPRAYFSVGT